MLRRIGYIQIHGKDGINPSMLWELANIFVRMLSIIFKGSRWPGDVPDDLKNTNSITLFFKKEDKGNYKAVSLSLASGKMMEEILKEAFSKHVKRWLATASMYSLRANWLTWWFLWWAEISACFYLYICKAVNVACTGCSILTATLVM